MPKQNIVETYSFSELSKSVQESLMKNYQINDSWDDVAIQTIEQEAEEMGINDFDVSYSGFWSQGDGLSFVGKLSEDLVEKIYKLKVNRDGFGEENPAFTVEFVRKSSMYCHENTVEAVVEGCPDEEDNRFFEGVFNEWKDELCKSWFNYLEDCYESQTNEDYIVEFYEDCGAVFLSDGRIL